jgi:osmotically-inducible protein OsmY
MNKAGMNRSPSLVRLSATLLIALAASTSLTACFPLLLGSAVVGSSVVLIDRRTTGSQIEDEAIELKAANRLGDVLGKRGNVSVTSYNQLVLIVGDVTSEDDRKLVEQTVSRIDKVRSIVNELAVFSALPASSFGSETLLTSRVKAALVDSKDPLANVVKVVSQRGTIYLMGRVTEREATQAAEAARSVSGVQKVVRVFEILTEAELAAMKTMPASNADNKPTPPVR